MLCAWLQEAHTRMLSCLASLRKAVGQRLHSDAALSLADQLALEDMHAAAAPLGVLGQLALLLRSPDLFQRAAVALCDVSWAAGVTLEAKGL